MHSLYSSSLFIMMKGITENQSAKKGLINYYSQKLIFSISQLQDNSSEVAESNIQRKPRGIYSSNITALSNTSFFSTICSTSPERNPETLQKGSIFQGKQ